jgi:hypothetical protein
MEAGKIVLVPETQAERLDVLSHDSTWYLVKFKNGGKNVVNAVCAEIYRQKMQKKNGSPAVVSVEKTIPPPGVK